MPRPLTSAPKFGRIKGDPSKPRLRFAFFRQAGAVAPAAVDWYGMPDNGMLGNDRYGDCVFAGNGHIIDEQTYYGQGVEFGITDTECLAEYTRVTGFDPNDPSTDNGAYIQDGLNDLRKVGLHNHKIAAFADVNVANLDDMKLATAEFGAVSIGFNFPASAMDQFNAGKPWSVVANDGGIRGGHCVIVFGYDASYIYVATWGQIQRMTYGFWNKYVDEAWAIIETDWVSAASGLTPTGVNKYALGEQFHLLTGEPNPFPAPAPTADEALAAYARIWLKTPRTRVDLVLLAADLKAWLAAHPEL